MYRAKCANCGLKIFKKKHPIHNNPFTQIYHFCSRACKLEWYPKVFQGVVKIERKKATA